MGLDQNAVRKSMWDLFPAELASQYHANNMEVLRTNEILKTQEISIDKFGNRRTFIVCKFPVNTKDEQRLIGGWSIDITDQKEAEQKVLEHSERLREIAFLQSHEVRRPLSNILSLIELIGENGDINGEIRGSHIVDYLKQSATELDDVIRKIMLKTRS
jgi:signal transduction histidine kinase